MIEVYKLVKRRVDRGTQVKKWNYYSKAKFANYSPNIIERHSGKDYLGITHIIEVYQLQEDNSWKKLKVYK